MQKKRYTRVLDRPIFNKKGQVTLFIILGIVLLIILVLIILLQREIVTITPGKIIPDTKDKIENQITLCVREVGEEALFKIGLQGGYLEFSDQQLRDGNYVLQTPVTPTPYWAYGNTIEIPSLQSIKESVDTYIEENIESCVFPAGLLDEEFSYISQGTASSDTEFTNTQVLYNVDWEIDVQTKDGELVTKLLRHETESKIKFKDLYETATKVIEQEINSLKFEDITQDLIALEHPNVPVMGMEISCAEKKWPLLTVQNTLKELITTNIPQIKVSGTEIVDFPKELPYYQNHYVWDVGEDFSKNDVSVTFRYQENFPFSFQVTPHDGSFLRSGTQGGSDILSALCVQMWKFTYDVSYPVLMKVKDENSGFVFNTAFTVHLLRNNPNRNGFVEALNPNTIPTIAGEEFCSNRRIPMTILTSSVVDSPETGVSFSEPVEEVNISFTCIKHKCDMGSTLLDFDNRGYQAGFTRNFPFCVGGILRATKNGYKESWQRVLTENSKQVEIELTPLYQVPVQNVKVVYHNVENDIIGPAMAITQDETAIVTIKSIKKNEINKPFHESTIVTSASGLDVEGFSTFELLAGADFTYDIDVTVFKNDLFVAGYKGNWTVPWNDLQQSTQIIIHTIGKEMTPEESFGFISKLPSQSILVSKPELK
jgi:hypothetical protein